MINKDPFYRTALNASIPLFERALKIINEQPKLVQKSIDEQNHYETFRIKHPKLNKDKLDLKFTKNSNESNSLNKLFKKMNTIGLN